MAELIITIDGPAGGGKSSVAQGVAQELNAGFLDTGAMYRAVTLAAMQSDVDLTSRGRLLEVLRENDFQFSITGGPMTVTINGKDVTDAIRLPAVTASAKYIASAPELRNELVKMQRNFAQTQKTIITEGRDQGTVAFPNANFKFFLTADVTERARRRKAQLAQNGKGLSIEQIQKDIEKRDVSDESRSVGPLTPAGDAVIIDTTDLSLEQVVARLMEYIKNV